MNMNVDFDEAPLLVIWEVTRSCSLACRHCRAEAIDQRHPDELTTDEGKALLDDIVRMETPIVVLTGGDPLQREDLEILIAYGKQIGLRMATIPAATPRLTRNRVASLHEVELNQMALSLDGCTAQKHDDFRRVEGSFEKTMEGAAWAGEFGIPLQINTVFGEWNYDDFDALAELVQSLGIVFWEVFFLVPTGRGAELQGCSAEQFEDLFGRLHQLSKDVSFVVKVTEAPHYRRFVAQQEPNGGVTTGHKKPPASHPGEHPGNGRALTVTRQGVNAGKGFCFVDHVGEVHPSGFLPLVTDNIREVSIVDTYRQAPVFKELRSPDLLKGRCGRCEFRTNCGGSRARAYALTDDYLAEDPCCSYVPAGSL